MQSVSIIIPCYNEQETIEKLLRSIYKQTYPRDNLEVVIADGMSTDGTRDRITKFADTHPDLHIALVDNPKRIIPAALNAAMAESQGEIIVRLDAHSMPRPDYIEQCVSDLREGLGENVGGIWEIHPGAPTWVAASIAAAAANPIGVGDALYRQARKPARVDTVPFGAFKRELLAVVGFFDETLLTNEDYEFNARIRKSGGTIWLDPKIRSVYFARPNLESLARQYARYGFWKWRMLKRYPETLRWRQGLPPLFVLFLLIGSLLAIIFPFLRVFYLAIVVLYFFILAITGFSSALKRRKPLFVIGIPLSIATMHISWGAGFLWSMIKGMFTTRMKQK